MNRNTEKSKTLPEGWRRVKLGEIMEFKNGFNAEKEKYGNGTKFVNVMDVFGHNYLYSNDVVGSVQVSEKQLSDYSVKYGDVLFNRTSETFEEIAVSSVYLDKIEIIFGGFVIRGRQKSNALIPRYSVYCFQSKDARKELIRRGQGAIRANIGQKDLSEVSIVIPPLREQKAIASLLETWDTAIEKTEALIAVKEKRFKWLLKTLIGDQQNNPKWQKVKLGDILSYEQPTKYIVNSTNYVDQGPVAVLTANKSFILGYTEEKSGIFNKYPVIIFDDFTTATKYVDFPFKVKSSAMKILKTTNENTNLEFVYYSMKFIDFPLGGHQRYWISEYQHLEIKLPSIINQDKTIAILNVAQKNLIILRQLAEKYRTQKCGLMQKLLTGKCRINPETLNKYQEV